MIILLMTKTADPLLITGPVDIWTFKAGIMMPFREIFSPVEIELDPKSYPKNPLCPSERFQALQDCGSRGVNEAEIKRALSAWGTYAAVVGAAQYSVRNNEPVLVIGRFDIKIREPTIREIERDLECFGVEQMLYDPETDRELNDNPKYILNDKEWAYVGPPRIRGFVFQTRVKKGVEGPMDFSGIEELVSDIEREVANVNEEIKGWNGVTPQAFYLFHADKGVLRASTFLKPTEYLSNNSKPHGKITIVDRRMLYYPNETSPPKDFTKELVSN